MGGINYIPNSIFVILFVYIFSVKITRWGFRGACDICSIDQLLVYNKIQQSLKGRLSDSEFKYVKSIQSAY